MAVKELIVQNPPSWGTLVFLNWFLIPRKNMICLSVWQESLTLFALDFVTVFQYKHGHRDRPTVCWLTDLSSVLLVSIFGSSWQKINHSDKAVIVFTCSSESLWPDSPVAGSHVRHYPREGPRDLYISGRRRGRRRRRTQSFILTFGLQTLYFLFLSVIIEIRTYSEMVFPPKNETPLF